jgi:hypothetical protein
MTDFDQDIKDALRHEPLDQAGIIEMAASNFRGRQRFSTIAMVVVGIVFMAAMIWCAASFFRTGDTRQMILYATLFLFLNGAIMMMKLWFWLMMIRYAVSRELKRLELQCSMLAERRI